MHYYEYSLYINNECEYEYS